MCRSHPCGQTREAPRIPPVPPECVPWTQTGLLAEATVVARRGAAECPRTRPGACGLSPSLVRPPPRRRRVCGGALTPSGVLGGVTFSVSHQPASHIAAGSRFPSPPCRHSAPGFVFRGVSSLCLNYPRLSPAEQPSITPPKAAVPFAETHHSGASTSPVPLPGGGGRRALTHRSGGRAAAWPPYCPRSLGRPGELVDPWEDRRAPPSTDVRQPRGLGACVGHVC